MLHLGLSGGWRGGQGNVDTTVAGGYTGSMVQLAAQSELRDDDPARQELLPNDNKYKMVDTGLLASDQEFITGLETLYIRGPFSVQAEYGWNWVNNVTGVVAGSITAPHVSPFAVPQDYVFSGGYLQVAYTLTGENRAYDRRWALWPGNTSAIRVLTRRPFSCGMRTAASAGAWALGTRRPLLLP